MLAVRMAWHDTMGSTPQTAAKCTSCLPRMPGQGLKPAPPPSLAATPPMLLLEDVRRSPGILAACRALASVEVFYDSAYPAVYVHSCRQPPALHHTLDQQP